MRYVDVALFLYLYLNMSLCASSAYTAKDTDTYSWKYIYRTVQVSKSLDNYFKQNSGDKFQYLSGTRT